MARKIRFPLKMKNGEEVRTLDELKENFDLESVLGYFTDGKLVTWLADRYYDDKAEAVSALKSDMPDLNAKLCEILEVEYLAEDDDTDMKLIARRREKLQILSGITDNREILDNIDLVAMSQDELYDILDESPEKIYLYGEKFNIPSGKKNICYIGVNKPLMLLEKGKYTNNYEESGICFKNVEFEKGVDNYGEKLFIAGKYKEAFPLIEENANNGNPRSMYIMALYYDSGYGTVKISIEMRNKWCKKSYSYNEPLSKYGYIKWCLDNGLEEQKSLYLQIFNEIKKMAENDDVFAQCILGSMHGIGLGVAQDYAKAVEWYKKAAEQGYAYAQYNLGITYDMGYGVTQDYAQAVEWYRKAAEQGYAYAQCNLGYMYQNGCGVTQDFAQAVEWYRKAAEQGNDYAQCNLGNMYYDGKGVEQDYVKAVEWFRKAAEQGYSYAQCNLGYMYATGNGTKWDQEEGLKWFEKAKIGGDELASKNVDEYWRLKNLGNGLHLMCYERHD